MDDLPGRLRFVSPDWIWYAVRMRQAMILSFLLVCSCPLGADESSLSAEPEIAFLTPLGGQRGTTRRVEIRGRTLTEANAVVFETRGITARIEKVEAVTDPVAEKNAQKKQERDIRVVADVDIAATVKPGNHWFRVVTPRGVTNRMLFRVTVDPVIQESETPHTTPDRAQPIVAPVVVNGSIGTAGEVDFYRFEVTKPCELTFEVRPSHAALARRFRPELGVFEKRASFFDPDRLARLAFADVKAARGEKVTMNTDPREREGSRIALNCRVPAPGRYFVRVGSLRGIAAPDYVYQLRMAPAEHPDLVEIERDDWKERSFTRKLAAGRLQDLWARSVRRSISTASTDRSADRDAPGKDEPGPDRIAARLPDPALVTEEVGETEPNGETREALAVSVPGIAYGEIAEPGDVDVFKFTVSDGQKLAFEVETPRATVPEFNPVIEVVDASGGERLSSLQRTEKYSSVTTPHLIAVSAKVIGTFEKGGDFYVRVRDLTLRNGAPSFAYRVLIRSQIPHVGNTALETRTRGPEDARVDPLRVNLIAGQARKITLLLDHEEGFFTTSNQIAVSFDGLPEGVELLAGSSLYQGPTPFTENKIVNRDHHLPVTEKVAAVLHASEDAPTTTLPVWITVSARPVVDGIPAARLTVERIPLMVLPLAVEAPRKPAREKSF